MHINIYIFFNCIDYPLPLLSLFCPFDPWVVASLLLCLLSKLDSHRVFQPLFLWKLSVPITIFVTSSILPSFCFNFQELPALNTVFWMWQHSIFCPDFIYPISVHLFTYVKQHRGVFSCCLENEQFPLTCLQWLFPMLPQLIWNPA